MVRIKADDIGPGVSGRLGASRGVSWLVDVGGGGVRRWEPVHGQFDSSGR